MSGHKHYKHRGWFAKFRCAFRGVVQGVPGQSSFVIFLPAALLVIILAGLLQVSAIEWCLLLGCIGAVVSTEYLNTAVELLAELVIDEYHEIAERCLNVSSAAVLIASFAAVLIGAIIFGGRLLQ